MTKPVGDLRKRLGDRRIPRGDLPFLLGDRSFIENKASAILLAEKLVSLAGREEDFLLAGSSNLAN